MSKPREAASRALMAAAKRAQALALDLRSALLAFEGEPRADTLVLQARRLASDVEEYAVALGRRPMEGERPIIAAIEAKANITNRDIAAVADPIREPVLPGPVQFPPGTSIPFIAGTRLFQCSRCHLIRRVEDGHPCGHCKNPEYGLVTVGPLDTLVAGWPEDGPPVERPRWKIFDDARTPPVELETVAATSEAAARKQARKRHPGLMRLRVEPTAAAP